MKAVFAGPEGWVSIAINMVGRLMEKMSEGSEREQQYSVRFDRGAGSVESIFSYGDTKIVTIEGV